MEGSIEPSVDNIEILRGVEKRAHARPCTLEGLACLERELEDWIRNLRREREKKRERSSIEPETLELRSAMQAARGAIRKSKDEHEAARLEIRRVAEMVRRGHVHEAALLRANGLPNSRFSDLNLDFVGVAVAKQHSREWWLVAVTLATTGIILVIITLIELLKRSAAGTP